MKELRVNGQRLWQRLMKMAEIGATPSGGVNRVALSDEDRRGRDLFVSWCKTAALQVTIDEMGNIFARRDGADNSLPPVAAGSHLDSQPTGGKFDGALGVLAALEVVETLNEADVTTHAPLEIISWTNEEGARFAPAMVSSGVFAGEFSPEYGWSRRDKNGRSLHDELVRIGYKGAAPVGQRPLAAFLELHIEQGPILEQLGVPIGVVTGVQGMRWYELTLTGQEAHAGTTPMAARRDPVAGLAALLPQLYALAGEYAPDVRLTVGDLRPAPGVINTVPGRLTLTLDVRHPETAVLDDIEEVVRELVPSCCSAAGLTGEVVRIWESPPVYFAEECITAVRQAAQTVGLPAHEMISGAGHDAVYISRVAPTSMIFVPCEGGLSHNEAENMQPAEAEAGANVLLQAMGQLAG